MTIGDSQEEVRGEHARAEVYDRAKQDEKLKEPLYERIIRWTAKHLLGEEWSE